MTTRKRGRPPVGQELDRDAVLAAVAAAGGNQRAAARALGVSSAAVHYYVHHPDAGRLARDRAARDGALLAEAEAGGARRGTQREIAREMGVSPQAVSERLRVARLRAAGVPCSSRDAAAKEQLYRRGGHPTAVEALGLVADPWDPLAEGGSVGPGVDASTLGRQLVVEVHAPEGCEAYTPDGCAPGVVLAVKGKVVAVCEPGQTLERVDATTIVCRCPRGVVTDGGAP